MPQPGFQFWEEGPLGRQLVAASPTGELLLRPHFGPNADRLIADRPIYGPAAALLSRADLGALAGVEFVMTDVPAGRMSRWVCDGVTLRPLHPVTLMTLAAPVAGAAVAAEQSPAAFRILLPAKLLGDGTKLRITTTVTKAGTTNPIRLFVHMGAAGGSGDTVVYDSGASTIPATTLAVSEVVELQRINATTVQVNGTLLGLANVSASAAPASATVANLDTAAQYVSLGVQTGTTDAPTARSLVIELIP